MRKLGPALLAASAALIPLSASAQTVPDPDLSTGTPSLALGVPAAAAAASAPPGVSWQHRSVGVPPAARMQGVMPPQRPGQGHGGQMHGTMPQRPGQWHGGQMHGTMPPPPQMHGRTPPRGPFRTYHPRRGMQMGGGHRSMRWERINRGGFVPPMWWGPQFQVHNWQMYGFPPPVSGGRWVRYYDDALLIDGRGRVLDGRYGWDWDRYGDRWGYNDDGVPVYAGDDEYESGEWDYGDDGPPAPPCGPRCGPGPAPAYGYGYGYYGYGPVVVTRTIVTEAPVVETRTVYETVVERVQVAPRKRVKRRCVCRVAAPPRPGERG